MDMSNGRRDPDEFDMTVEEWEAAFQRATPTRVVTTRAEFEAALGTVFYTLDVSLTADQTMPPVQEWPVMTSEQAEGYTQRVVQRV
jgi:hypothetical protein